MTRKRRILWGIGIILLVVAVFGWQDERRKPPTALTLDQETLRKTVYDIPSIDEPTTESVFAADQYINDDSFGLAVTIGSTTRFYPYQILNWHEVANDTIASTPILVTYSPLTDTGRVFERRIGTETPLFHASDDVVNNNLVLEDDQGRRWQQLTAQGEGGGTLASIPAVRMTWRTFKRQYPRSRVLGRPSTERFYTEDPYRSYHASNDMLFPVSHKDARLPAKQQIFGVINDGRAIAYTSVPQDQPLAISSYWFAWVAFYPDTAIID